MRLFHSQVIGDNMIKCHEIQRMSVSMSLSIVATIKKIVSVGKVYDEKIVLMMILNIENYSYFYTFLTILRAPNWIACVIQF